MKLGFKTWRSRRAASPAEARPQTGKHKQQLPVVTCGSVNLYHWTPGSDSGLRNFGDELSPLIVDRLARRRTNADFTITFAEKGRNRLFAIGSNLHAVRDGDVVWGAGINGKRWPNNLKKVSAIDVRSVRGPVTRKALLEYGIDCPESFGDPGLLFPSLFKTEIGQVAETTEARYGKGAVLYIPNINDDRFFLTQQDRHCDSYRYISPSESPFVIAHAISQAALVISSSLHGIILADVYGVPCRAVLSQFEPILKYTDHFEATGRRAVQFAPTPLQALSYPDIPPPKLDVAAILETFPADLFTDAV